MSGSPVLSGWRPGILGESDFTCLNSIRTGRVVSEADYHEAGLRHREDYSKKRWRWRT